MKSIVLFLFISASIFAREAVVPVNIDSVNIGGSTVKQGSNDSIGTHTDSNTNILVLDSLQSEKNDTVLNQLEDTIELKEATENIDLADDSIIIDTSISLKDTVRYSNHKDIKEIDDWLTKKRIRTANKNNKDLQNEINRKVLPYSFKVNFGVSFFEQKYLYSYHPNSLSSNESLIQDTIQYYRPSFGIELGFTQGVYLKYSFLNLKYFRNDLDINNLVEFDEVEFDYIDFGYFKKIKMFDYHYLRYSIGPSVINVKFKQKLEDDNKFSNWGLSNSLGYETNILERFSFFSDFNLRYHEGYFDRKIIKDGRRDYEDVFHYRDFHYGLTIGVNIIFGKLPK